ncbi:MAG TPA: TonB family protein [Candidatus Sulfotelmatobacter sp.]|nr:TonB family protein [Candidatus Sulfotelmatobacter sp.]
MSNPGLWKTWQGRIVDGKFPLRQWLGGSDHSAVFLTERPGQPSSKAAIKLIAADGAEADRQLARWRSASQLSHPHLMRIYESGRCRLDSTALLYVVMEFAEEDLSQILPQRPLAPAEVTDLLPPVLDALSYLHSKGFVHTRIKPSNVLAIGDQLKLSADQIVTSTETNSARRRRDAYDAPETAAGIISPAGDVWSVGVTLVAALTQTVSFAEQQSLNDPDPPSAVPEPFRGIARECLHLDPKRRCSITQIQARLHPAARSVPAPARQTLPQPRTVLKRGHIAAAVLVVLLIALVVYFSRGKSGTSPAPPATGQLAPQAQPQAAPIPKPNPAVRESAATAERPSAAGGDVAHQVVPDISQSSRKTISGTIKVTVRVEADSSGKVRTAKLKTAGPSRYFAEQALKAAQRWEFVPPQVDGQSAPSTWLVQFRFRRSGTQASAERVVR